MILKASTTQVILKATRDPSSNKSVIIVSCETYHGYFFSFCDLSVGRHLSLVLTFYVKGAPQFHSFRAHFRLKQTSKFLLLLLLHSAGDRSRAWCVPGECTTMTPSEAPLGGAWRNCPPSRPQLCLSSADPTPQLTANSEQPLQMWPHNKDCSTRASGTSSSSAAAGIHIPVLWFSERCQRKLGKWGSPTLLSGIHLTTAAVASHMCEGSRGALDCGHRSSLSVFIFRSFVS